ncbi:MAG: hypothetical protein IT334_04110 [Thermomicrobiales bacterium]|nr:hypothetical protein [Thermomicrobiales bacterium]
MTCGGVRNCIFQSTTFGSTLVWDQEKWAYAESDDKNDADTVVLNGVINANAMLDDHADRTRLEISFREKESDNTQSDLVAEKYSEVLNRGTGHTGDIPAHGWKTASGRYIDGNGDPTKWSIETHIIEPNTLPGHESETHIVVMLLEHHAHNCTRNEYVSELVDSIEPAAPEWVGACAEGIIAVTSASLDPGSDTFTATLELVNIDTEEAKFYIERLQLDGAHELTGWTWDGVSGEESPYILPAGSEVTGVFTFTSSEADSIAEVFYQQPTRRILLARVTPIEGPSSGPRINPGG